MPIYEYACHACGLEKEHLQKMSDPPIAQCPACGSTDYVKKVSAAGFQLKGTGWYVTDFRNKSVHSGSESKKESGKESGNTSQAATNTTSDSSATTAKADTSTPATSSAD